MNLFHKKAGLLITLGALFFLSCKDSSDLQVNPGTDSNQFGTYLVDTFSANVSTEVLPIDSISAISRPNAKNYLLFGQSYDPYLGLIKANAYTEVGYNKTTFKSTDEYISFEILLDLDYTFGNSSGNQEIFIHRLTTPIDTNVEYTIDKTVASNDALINEATTIDLSKSSYGKIRLKLSDDLGHEFFNAIKENSPNFQSQKAFVYNYFNGLVITGGSSNTAILGADPDSSRIVLKYKTDTLIQELNFSLSYPYQHFNHIDRQTVSSPQGVSYIQSCTGIASKLSFPDLEKIKDMGKNWGINRAELIITPEPDDNVSPPSNLFLLWYPDGNFVNSPVQKDASRPYIFTPYGPNYSFYNSRAIQSGLFAKNQELNNSALNIVYYPDQKKYKADITSYLEYLIKNNSIPTEFLLYPEAAGNMVNSRFSYSIDANGSIVAFSKDMTVNRAVIKKENIQLKIYYTTLPE